MKRPSVRTPASAFLVISTDVSFYSFSKKNMDKIFLVWTRYFFFLPYVFHNCGSEPSNSANQTEKQFRLYSIIIIISLFQEDNIFGTNASLTYGPRLQR